MFEGVEESVFIESGNRGYQENTGIFGAYKWCLLRKRVARHCLVRLGKRNGDSLHYFARTRDGKRLVYSHQ